MRKTSYNAFEKEKPFPKSSLYELYYFKQWFAMLYSSHLNANSLFLYNVNIEIRYILQINVDFCTNQIEEFFIKP